MKLQVFVFSSVEVIVENRQRSLKRSRQGTGAFVNCMASGVSEEEARNQLRDVLLELSLVPITLGETMPFEKYGEHGKIDRRMSQIAGQLSVRSGAECLEFHEYALDQE